MTSTQMGVWGGLKICHTFTGSIVFKQMVYCSLLRMGWGVACGRHIVRSLILKITLIKK